MDLSVHRTILFLAIERLKKSPNLGKFFIDPAKLTNDLFYPMWQGNWLTDMNQASAFFDVLENKYRDPYTRWKPSGQYDFPIAIRKYQTEWVNMYNALWREECKEVAGIKEFKLGTCSAAVIISDPSTVGGYYPFDHFDVADRQRPLCPTCKLPLNLSNNLKEWKCSDLSHPVVIAGEDGDAIWEPVPDTYEYDNAVDGLSWTAHRGVFTECLKGPLNSALSCRTTDPADLCASLRYLGKATHILQDFYAHSNYVELLLECADPKLLPAALVTALDSECAGSFASFLKPAQPKDAIVVTGRFDQVDTVASILKVYRENLVVRWNDLEAGGYLGNRGKTRDLMVEVLFGTFSNQPFTPRALGAIKKVFEVTDFLSEVGDRIKRGTISFFGWLAKKLTDRDAEESIDKVQDLLLAANDVQAKDYAKAGRIMYLERVIEKDLLNKLEADRAKNSGKVLPHHTLLAKDQDTAQPECRLAYKIACLMAVDLTAQILEQYLLGKGALEVERVLAASIMHPSTQLTGNPQFSQAFYSRMPQLYGERWYLVANSVPWVFLP